MRFAFLALILASVCQQASAHPLDLALVNLEGRDGGVRLSVEVNPAAAAKAAPLDGAELTVAGKRCALGAVEKKIVNPQNTSFTASALCPAASGSLELKLPFLSSQGPGYRAIFMSRVGGGEQVGDADGSRPWIRVDVKQDPATSRFVAMGIEHIGATPDQWSDGARLHLPEGIDHILFVVALVLAGGSMLNVLKTVSGFTIGHSITLALATLGLVHVSSRIVESAIALSIAVVAVEGLILKASHARWKLALAFGLIHGLGFASALTDLNLTKQSLVRALLGFNVGVELGQAVVVAAVFPLLLLLGKSRLARRYAVPACSIAVFLTGSIWFIQRAWVA
jgi:hypothetical protein